MTDLLFLVYIPDFFGVEGTYVQIFDESGKQIGSQLPDQSVQKIVLSYEASTLIDEYKRIGIGLPATLIDIGEAFRLIAGRARDEGAEKSWNVFRKMAKSGENSHVVADFISIVQGRKERPQEAQLNGLMSAAAQVLKALWTSANEHLKTSGEFDRFWNVEFPFSQICWYRQWAGIHLRSSAVSDALSSVRTEKYAAYRRLAQTIRSSPSGLSFRNIRSVLPGTDLSYLLEIEDNANLEAEFRLASGTSELAEAFVEYVRSSRDEHILSRVSGEVERVYPTFQPIGTVTGRTLVSDPNLQNLRRAYRSIIDPEPDKRLAYLDFAQFEPGIAAYLSQDHLFINDYNTSDIYAVLSEHVFGTRDRRALTKRAFISYLYGMSEERIGRLLSGPNQQIDVSRRLTAFFARYSGLKTFRTACQNRLYRQGYIGTVEGNNRRRLVAGHLTSKERRWAANQPIQGTASLILKEAMLAIQKEFGSESLVVPVHDVY